MVRRDEDEEKKINGENEEEQGVNCKIIFIEIMLLTYARTIFVPKLK